MLHKVKFFNSSLPFILSQYNILEVYHFLFKDLHDIVLSNKKQNWIASLQREKMAFLLLDVPEGNAHDKLIELQDKIKTHSLCLVVNFCLQLWSTQCKSEFDKRQPAKVKTNWLAFILKN